MTKAELENKHIAELHTLAAEAGVERYRMLPRAELIAKLAGEASGSGAAAAPSRERSSGRKPAAASAVAKQGERPPRRRRRRSGAKADSEGESSGSGREPRAPRAPRAPRQPERASEPAPAPPPPPAAAPAAGRRVFVPPQTPPPPSLRPPRQAGGRDPAGPAAAARGRSPGAGLRRDPRGLHDAAARHRRRPLRRRQRRPRPGSAADRPQPRRSWPTGAATRPKAEIVAAGQPRHASDALAQASARAAAGDDVILLVDSLTRLGEAYEDADAAKQFFDAGRVQAGSGSGSLTVVAALERPA